MKANSTKSWFKKWWLWVLLGLAATIYILSRVFPSGEGKPGILHKAKDEAKRIKEDAVEKLEAHIEMMQEKHQELERIKVISDEEKRLRALADFANRRNTS